LSELLPRSIELGMPAIILIDPQMGENIGAAARAMLNFGLTDLRIVRPRDGWPNERADAMSAGALASIPPVPVFDTAAQAVADCHFVYATTARTRDMEKPVVTARAAVADMCRREGTGQKTAILFGGERAGLTNDDVALAHGIITIPVNPGFSSLNLAITVACCAYEWGQQKTLPSSPSDPQFPAPQAEFPNFVTRLEGELQTRGFFRSPEMQPTVMRNIRAALSRAEMTAQEINTFQGILTALTTRKIPD